MSVLKSDLEKAFDIQVDNLYYIYADIINEIFKSNQEKEKGTSGSDYLDKVFDKNNIKASVAKSGELLREWGYAAAQRVD